MVFNGLVRSDKGNKLLRKWMLKKSPQVKRKIKLSKFKKERSNKSYSKLLLKGNLQICKKIILYAKAFSLNHTVCTRRYNEDTKLFVPTRKFLKLADEIKDLVDG
jgi:uncharacterized protein YueI